jgi:23S rRNA G2445 N2-methylase RlmL
MSIVILCDPGFEEYVANTIPGSNAMTSGLVVVDELSKKEILSLYYTLQPAVRILIDAVVADTLVEALHRWSVPDWWKKDKTFKVRATGFDDNHDAARLIGDDIKRNVDLDDPDVLVYTRIVNDKVVLGIDVSQVQLQKREYRIYTNPAMLRSSFAASLLLAGDHTPEKTLLDPFCGSGTICIEAALHMTGTSPHTYRKQDFLIARSGFATQDEVDTVFSAVDSRQDVRSLPIYGYDELLKRVTASNHNAKIAGILDALHFSRASVDWLDTKVDEKSIDCIITHPPLITEENKKKVLKVYDELFYQAAFVLRDDGLITIAAITVDGIEEAAKKHKFSLKHSFLASMGKQPYTILQFVKA